MLFHSGKAENSAKAEQGQLVLSVYLFFFISNPLKLIMKQ